jgi:DNA polymerase III subunit delta
VSSPSVCVVGTDSTMVYDAVHNVVANALGDLDPSFALQDFTAKDVTASPGESTLPRVLEALNTPPFLVERRVVVVRDAQLLVADEVALLTQWMGSPAPGTVLILAVVGSKANRLVKAASEVVEVNVGTRVADRVAFVKSKMDEYGVVVDPSTAQRVADQVGDDVARIDALARTLQSIYGSAPLTFARIEPYLGDAGDVPAWDLTDAIDAGDATKAIVVARRMLKSRQRAGLQIVSILQRHYLNMARLEGSEVRTKEEAATLLGVNAYPAGKSLQMADRLGAERLTSAVHWITDADLALKGGVSYGGKDLDSDLDVTELTVIEVLVARLARLTYGARRR